MIRTLAALMLLSSTCALADEWDELYRHNGPKARAYLDCHFRNSPLRIGMTENEVLSTCWGKPNRVDYPTISASGESSTWRYWSPTLIRGTNGYLVTEQYLYISNGRLAIIGAR